MIGNLLVQAIRMMCECCYDDCDCGCVLECPLPNHRAAVTVDSRDRHPTV